MDTPSDTTTKKIKAKPGYRQAYQVRVKHVAGETRNPTNGAAIRTLDEVAQILGTSRQAVHQVERSAMFKLRQAFGPEIAEINPQFHQACVAQQQQQCRH